MPHTNIWEPDGLYRVFTGEVNGDEIFKSNTELHADFRFKKIDYIINDFSQMTGHSIDMSHTEVYASTDIMISRTKHKLKIALVVPQPALQDLAKNYCDLMKGQVFECDIFQTLEEARNWSNNLG